MAKEITWRGKLEEEVKKLDLKSFMTLIPARQRRSLVRGLTEQQKKVLKSVEEGKNNIKTHCRDMVILPAMIGKTFKVYNGKEYIQVIVTLEMIGHVLGEFAMTRKLVSHSSAGIGATRSSKAVTAR